MKEAIDCLLNNAGPVVRYLTLRDLAQDAPAGELPAAREALRKSPGIAKLLDRAREAAAKPIGFNQIHGSADACWENILPMLLDRGVDRTFAEFDELMRAIMPQLERFIFPESHCFHSFTHIILCPFLLAAGYRDGLFRDLFERRLTLVAGFCSTMDFDIFGEQSSYKGIPKPFRDRRVIRPELYSGGLYRIPLIYDLYALAAMYPYMEKERRILADTILSYVMAEEYQRLPHGYGLLANGPRHYYAMGWDCRLPQDAPGEFSAATLRRMELLHHFPIATESKWCQEKKALLLSFQRDDGLFILPKAALREQTGYWVTAAHMSLDENRKAREWAVMEGTYRAMRAMGRMNN